jgi:SAM-dependent methyltransferase
VSRVAPTVEPAPLPPATAEGLRRIVAFNWPKLVVAGASSVAGVVIATLTPSPALALLALAGAALALYGIVAALAVSWWVYDHSDLHEWRWLAPLMPHGAGRWALVHAGFDETGPLLPAALGGTAATVVDLSPWLPDPAPSLRRARRRHPAPPAGATPATPEALPLGPLANDTCDTVLLVFAAHEVRDPHQRDRLFAELHRVLRPDGRVVLVEHLRDGPNFVAFGPGALHFRSRRTWLDAAGRAGLVLAGETTKTCFVRGMALCPT